MAYRGSTLNGDLRFCILGPLQVWVGDSRLRLFGPRQERVLAALLLDAGERVSLERLVDVVWAEDPPSTARKQVQDMAGRLRRTLNEVATHDVLTTERSGYRLHVEDDQLDARRFEKLVAAARGLAPRDAEVAVANFRVALGLWQGAALADVQSPELDQAKLAWDERRVVAWEECLALQLRIGRQHDVIADLRDLVDVHPYREGLVGLLMRALSGTGERAEALEIYHRLRRRLAEELGIDPGHQLKRIYEGILREDEVTPDQPPDGPPDPSAPPAGPSQLPASIGDFTGRTAQVSTLSNALRPDSMDAAATTCPVAAIFGMGGVGKSTLALHVAHSRSPSYPDGQLYAKLGGTHGRPATPSAVLGDFLRALAVETSAIPTHVDERAALFRERLKSRAVLVVLDDAHDEDQVRPLLPAPGACGVLITSRQRLGGLAGANHLDLDVFDPAEAIDLLTVLAGRDPVKVDAAAAATVVQLCGYLPLAIRVAGARFAAHPYRGLAYLAENLRDERQRMAKLSLRDLDVRGSLSLSYVSLSPEGRHMFQLLGLLDAPDFAAWVAAAMLRTAPDVASELLHELVQAQLLGTTGPDRTGHNRFRFHDLVRLFARERAQAELSADQRRSALTHALEGWLALAQEGQERSPDIVLAPIHGPQPTYRLPDALQDSLLTQASTWFEVEAPGLVAAAQQAVEHGLSHLIWQLPAASVTATGRYGDGTEWRTAHRAGLEHARATGDRLGQAVMLRNLAYIASYGSIEAELAVEQAEEARALFASVGNADGESDALFVLSTARQLQGRIAEALEYASTGLAVAARGTRPAFLEAKLLQHIGLLHRIQGRLEEAGDCLKRAYALARGHGYARLQQWTARVLAIVHRELGEYQAAETYTRECLDVARSYGYLAAEAQDLALLGQIRLLLGHSDAKRFAERGYRLARDCGLAFSQALGLRTLAEIELAQGSPERAVEHLNAALTVWRDQPDTQSQALSYKMLGQACRALGNEQAARHHWLKSINLFEKLGNAREVAAVQAWLEAE